MSNAIPLEPNGFDPVANSPTTGRAGEQAQHPGAGKTAHDTHRPSSNEEACQQAAMAVWPAATKCYNDIVNQNYNALTLDAIALVA